MNEIWRDIPSLPYYQASSLGRIRSLPGRTKFSRKTICYLKCRENSTGYLRFGIPGNKTFFVHRAVAEAFLGLANGLTVNHKDSNRKNNNLDNLEYMTQSENIVHARNLGRIKKAFSLEQVLEIKKIKQNDPNVSSYDVASKFKVNATSIQKIWSGSTWTIILFLFLSSCRNSTPPPMDICILDGFGGADCVLKDGTRAYRSPTQLKNYWATTEFDMQGFSSWCYHTNSANIRSQMNRIKKESKE